VRKEAKHERNTKPERAGRARDLSLDRGGDTSASQRVETVNLVLKLNASSRFCCCEQELCYSFGIGGICVQIFFSDPHLLWPGVSSIGRSGLGLSVGFSKDVLFGINICSTRR